MEHLRDGDQDIRDPTARDQDIRDPSARDQDTMVKTINHHGKPRTVRVAPVEMMSVPVDTEMVGRINILILVILNIPRRTPPNLLL